MLRRSLEGCGKIFIIRAFHGGCVAATLVIDPFRNERGNGLRAIGTYEARYTPIAPIEPRGKRYSHGAAETGESDAQGGTIESARDGTVGVAQSMMILL